MTNDQITYLVAGVCALAVLVAFVALIVRPAWGSYSRGWERVAAAFLSLYVLLALLGVGAGASVGVVYVWDRISG